MFCLDFTKQKSYIYLCMFLHFEFFNAGVLCLLCLSYNFKTSNQCSDLAVNNLCNCTKTIFIPLIYFKLRRW